jgi:ABC-2 type transport system permease protein
VSAVAPDVTTAPSFLRCAWLVTEREVGAKLRSRAFLISTGILFLIALGGILWAGFAGLGGDRITVAVTADTAAVLRAAGDAVEPTQVATANQARDLVRTGEVEAALIPGGAEPFGYTVVADRQVPGMLVSLLSSSPPVELLSADIASAGLRYLIAVGFGLIFSLAALTFGMTIAQSVVEEKQTRVVELLISAIPTRALLAGKVLGNTVLAMGQVIGLAAITAVGLRITGQTVLLAGLGAPIVWFAVFFLFGFILLAALFAAAAAMVSRQEDVGSTTTPLTIVVMAPYLLVIAFNDNPLVLTIMSYVPFSAPVGMPVRIHLGEVQWWEPFASLFLLLATCVAAIAAGARIYQYSILRMGPRVKLSEALA